jgi:hypothetical protein
MYIVISINSIDSTMEPIFAESAGETVTAELHAQLDAAVAALPLVHSTRFGGSHVGQLRRLMS